MRRLRLPRLFVLRTALRLLLALLLCLNGAVAPVAMAAMPDATVSAAAAGSAESTPHCHGDEDAAPAAPAATSDDGGHDHAKHPSCCKPGHCACACAFSLDLPDHTVAGDAARSRREQPLPRNVPLPALRDGVPLRPPIV